MNDSFFSLDMFSTLGCKFYKCNRFNNSFIGSVDTCIRSPWKYNDVHIRKNSMLGRTHCAHVELFAMIIHFHL